MKKVLIFLLPFALWADYLFVLHDVGETLALMPVIEELLERGETVEVIRLDPTDRYSSIEIERVAPDVLVVGDASIGQLQYVRAFKGKSKTVCYYDNTLEIDRIPYADLIREFEKEVDLFLVPSALAAKSSCAAAHIVGNPDLDRFENKVGEFEVVPGRVVYFGGYDKDYEEAFKAFLELYPDAIVYPHPKTDGVLERSYGAHIGKGASLQAVGEAEIVVVHRSSIGVKAALAGKTAYSVESDGSIHKITTTRASLNVPQDSVHLICDLLL